MSQVVCGGQAAGAATAQTAGVTPDKWLFEPTFGLPIVRRYLKCAPMTGPLSQLAKVF